MTDARRWPGGNEVDKVANRPYTLVKARRLSVGSALYVEFRGAGAFAHCDGPAHIRDNVPEIDSSVVELDDDGKFIPINSKTTSKFYGIFYRFWHSQPTDEDKAAAKWDEEG